MIECIILGDSIARGVSQHHSVCKNYSVVGINTSTWNKTYGHVDLEAATVIVSLGTNDKGLSITEQLLQLLSTRDKIKSPNIVWINPPCNDKFCNKEANYVIQTISTLYGDTIIETVKLGRDGIHPTSTGYKEMAEQIKAKSKPQTVLPMWSAEKFGQTNLGTPKSLLPQN
jgi:hypothetical protein